jgi:hypothetical protein
VIEFEIVPDPEPDEAAALMAALDEILADDGTFDPPAAYASRWRRAGVPEPAE